MPSSTSIKRGIAAAVLATLPLARAQGTTPPKLTAACNNVAIFMARGNDAPYHDGRTSPFIDATCGKFKAAGYSCDYMDIVFDATLGVPYCPTIQEGAYNGVRQITEYNAQCPDTLIVINGYSQGAMVAGSLLSGGGADACDVDTKTTGLDSTSPAGKAVKAALLWGDVKHTANQPYNVLDGADKQVWPRTGSNLERLNRYSDVLRSYCAAGDPVCASGNVVADHLNYFELYTDAASTWVLNKLTPLLAKSSSSATPTPTPTPVSSVKASSTVVPTPTSTVAPNTTVTPSAKPTTMVSSYVSPSINGTSSAISTNEPATAYPVTVVPSASKYYGNSTMPASSPIKTSTKPQETVSLPVGQVSHPAAPSPTKAPGYSAQPPACPAPTVYETVTHVVYEYV
ncbi:carbohydrate esterase family 5 protein [Exserohilum turcica Et28A]|uniref:Carbohydrate esterase family 5 protein n=1 Tax=Exserohilum turcicum (strain 28A) TaxID=671987 RepID=R0IST7_EXST2|nr:carbohydrate esterase family 5 protein [Exserohilum turcica Et28A]EOA87686.1 carbohydrate esterase family 5 protein [Exserohilum turcica Et28A]